MHHNRHMMNDRLYLVGSRDVEGRRNLLLFKIHNPDRCFFTVGHRQSFAIAGERDKLSITTERVNRFNLW